MDERKTAPADSDSDEDSNIATVQPNQTTRHQHFKRTKFVKSEEDNIPLPDPFELPKNFRPDVTDAFPSTTDEKREPQEGRPTI